MAAVVVVVAVVGWNGNHGTSADADRYESIATTLAHNHIGKSVASEYVPNARKRFVFESYIHVGFKLTTSAITATYIMIAHTSFCIPRDVKSVFVPCTPEKNSIPSVPDDNAQ